MIGIQQELWQVKKFRYELLNISHIMLSSWQPGIFYAVEHTISKVKMTSLNNMKIKCFNKNVNDKDKIILCTLYSVSTIIRHNLNRYKNSNCVVIKKCLNIHYIIICLEYTIKINVTDNYFEMLYKINYN